MIEADLRAELTRYQVTSFGLVRSGMWCSKLYGSTFANVYKDEIRRKSNCYYAALKRNPDCPKLRQRHNRATCVERTVAEVARIRNQLKRIKAGDDNAEAARLSLRSALDQPWLTRPPTDMWPVHGFDFSALCAASRCVDARVVAVVKYDIERCGINVK